MSRYKILHMIGSSFFGGPEKQIIEHLKELDSSFFSGIVASFIEPGAPENGFLDRARDNNIPAYEINVSGPFDSSVLHKISSLINKESINILCVHGYKAVVLGVLIGKKLKIPVLAFSRGYTSENFKVRLYEKLERMALSRADGVVAVSNGQKNKLDQFRVKYNKCWVVHNSVAVQVDTDDHKYSVYKEFGVPKGSKLIVAAGRLSPEKGHRYLLSAIEQLVTSVDNVFFLICGDGTCFDDLTTQVAKAEIGSVCKFAGFRDDLDRIFMAMDIMVLPSLTEGLPNVILESFARKKPVVSTDVGGVSELVLDEESGLLVRPSSPKDLALAMRRLVENESLCKSMGLRGFQNVKENFSFKQQAHKLQEIYSSLINN